VNAVPVEYASERKIREYNKLHYRFNHWPIWIFVFFIAPGPLTFDLFERGFDARMALWLGAVLVGTGIAGLRGALPGVEPKPYIIRFTEDRPNPLYRRVCYTFAWSEVVAFAVLNVAGLVVAIATGHWYLKQIYWYAYFPIAGTIWLLGALGQLPRVKASTKGEGHERRYFYGSVWAVCWAQPALWLLWKVVPRTTAGDTVKLVVFLAILCPAPGRSCPERSPSPTRSPGVTTGRPPSSYLYDERAGPGGGRSDSSRDQHRARPRAFGRTRAAAAGKRVVRLHRHSGRTARRSRDLAQATTRRRVDCSRVDERRARLRPRQSLFHRRIGSRCARRGRVAPAVRRNGRAAGR
jgi:hypothetical protein